MSRPRTALVVCVLSLALGMGGGSGSSVSAFDAPATTEAPTQDGHPQAFQSEHAKMLPGLQSSLQGTASQTGSPSTRIWFVRWQNSSQL